MKATSKASVDPPLSRSSPRAVVTDKEVLRLKIAARARSRAKSFCRSTPT